MSKITFPAFLICLFSIISPISLSATTYITAASGYWNTNNIWQNGIAPPFTTSDTIIIKNFIQFTSEITLIGPAYLRVDSSGALCGHDTIFSNAGSRITTYGILECDVLEVPGGHLSFFPPGYIIFTQLAHLWNGASLQSSTTINVGPWFNCLTKSSDIEEQVAPKFNIYPNPAGDFLNISDEHFFDAYFIYDMSGRIIQSGTHFINSLDISNLANGYYILELRNKESVFRKKFIRN